MHTFNVVFPFIHWTKGMYLLLSAVSLMNTFIIPESLHHRMYEMERSLEALTPDMERSTQDCKAVISGLLCGKPVQWEVAFDVSQVLKARLREETLQEDLWSETFHHLAARSVIRDFEQMADKECEIEHGEDANPLS